MKCPFRKETITITSYDSSSTKESFQQCYEDDCPYYIADEQDVTKFRCARCVDNAE